MTTENHIDLADKKLEILKKAIQNVLNTENALNIFAQLIDGLPLLEEIEAIDPGSIAATHPARQHKNICRGVREMAATERNNFSIQTLVFEAQVLQQFDAAADGSRQFGSRLIELVVEAVHQIGAYLFEKYRDHPMHDPTTVQDLSVEKLRHWSMINIGLSDEPIPTFFMLPSFCDWEQCPNKLADCAGYWAENAIIGGVTLFDRSKSWIQIGEEPNVYIQSFRMKVTHQACQLLDEQQDSFVKFLLAPDPEVAKAICPLPIIPGPENRQRIDPNFAISVHQVYRNLWERKELSPHVLAAQARAAAHRPKTVYHPTLGWNTTGATKPDEEEEL